MVAFVGTGNVNVTIAVTILGIPPILTNAFVGVRQVDRDAVDAARGIGDDASSRSSARVELPLAIPTIMGGVRTASVNIIATVDDRLARRRRDARRPDPRARTSTATEGVIAGAIVVALLALTFELVLAGVQRLLTPRGLALQRAAARASA